MVCPINNTKEWKEFVDSAGSEFQAYAQFYMNNYKIPGKTEHQTVTDELTTAVRGLQKLTKVRENIMFSLSTVLQEQRSKKKNKESVERIINLLDTLEKTEINESVEILINNGLSVLKRAEENKKETLSGLKNTKQFVDIFEDISDIKDFITISDIEDKDSLFQKLKELNEKIKDFNKEYVSKSKRLLSKEMAPLTNKIRDQYRLKYEIEFKKNNPKKDFKGSDKEYKDAQQTYINEKINQNEIIIREETEQYLYNELETAQQDITSMSAWLDDPRDIKDPIIQIMVKMLDDADFEISSEYINSRKDLDNAYEDYIKEVGYKANKKELYEGILEKIDGKETGYYVGRVYNYVFEEYRKLWGLHNNIVLSDKAKKEKVDEFIEKHISDNFKDKYKKNNDLLFEKIGLSNDSDNLYNIVKNEFKNPQWEAIKPTIVGKNVTFITPQGRMWKALKDYNKASDTMMSGSSKLRYKLPTVQKSEEEFLQESNYKDYIKTKIKDYGKLNANDIENGALETLDGVTKVVTDKNGKVVKRVNTPFRGEIDLNNQSFDLMSISLANRYASLNYKYKNNIKSTLEVAKDLLEERHLKVTKNNTFLKTAYRKLGSLIGEKDYEDELKEIEIKGKDSNSYKLLTSIIEDRIYGKSKVDAGEIFGLDGNKLADTLTSFTSLVYLSANYSSAVSNTLQGKVMNFLEGVSGRNITRTNLRGGETAYWKDIKGIIGDIESRIPNSLTSLLREKFLTTNIDLKHLTDNYTRNTKVGRSLKIGSLQLFNNTAEHYIQNTLMYSVLDSIEINGKKLHELYKVENGKLITPKGVDEKQISRKIKAIMADLHGNYDSANKAMIQRYWYGRLAMGMRKWIVRTVNRRYKNIGTTGVSIEEQLKKFPHLLHYSEELEQFKEGTHTSLIRFIRASFNNIKKLKLELISKNFDNLTDMEISNIKSAVTELSILTASLLSAVLLAMLANGDDDEDNEYIYFVAYSLRRLYGELSFYSPITGKGALDALRVLRTPATSMNIVENSLKIITQVFEDLFSLELEKDHQDNIKLYKLTNKTFNPFYRQFINRNYKKMYHYLEQGEQF